MTARPARFAEGVMDDPYDYTPPPKVMHVVRCTYRHIGRGKPMQYPLE